ncbi:MAG: energy-coupling factor transporter transmembrane protein EcfT [Caldiserica bacterium]|nr:energy-coupling factor transporter transmembrane protein EcfT [Caldisericota bacterium]
MADAVPAVGRLRSPLRGIDPRVRIAYAAAFAVFVVLTPVRHPLQFLAHGALVATLYVASGLPASSLLKRLGVASAFVAIVTLSAFLGRRAEGVPFPELALRLWAKPLLAVAGVTALVSGMEGHQLLLGLRGLWVPRAIGDTLLFLLRYAPTLGRRIAALRMGVEARSPGWRGLSGRRRLLSSLGGLVGTAFLRSLDHGEEVYRAMLARGFSGELPRPRIPLKPRDLAFLLAGIALLSINLAFVP